MKIKLNIRKLAIVAFLPLMVIAAKAEDVNFAITIKPAQPMPGYKAFLFYKKGPGTMTIDSADFVNGKFELKGSSATPQKAVMYVAKANTNFGHGMNTKPGFSVYLENGNILVSGKLAYETAKRSGTPLNNDYQDYLDAIRPFAEKEAAFLIKNKAASDANDSTAIVKLGAEYFERAKVKRKAEETFFNTHLNSLVAFEWLKNNMNAPQDRAKALAMLNKMSEGIKNSNTAKIYQAKLEKTVSVELGSQAPDFSAKSLKGETISLSSLKGKYVLLDFWASWCVPCRKENPNVLKAYNKYQSKNFMVFAFSLDESKAAWEKAVAQDGMPWIHVSDLTGFYSPVVYLYGIQSIPGNVLIDPSGKIIARDLRGNDLEKALEKLL